LQFGLPNRIGLTDLFQHPLDSLSGVTQRAKLPGLAVMTSGVLPPNPTELLTSKTMALILDQLNREFDLIVIDTPPVLTVTDAAALAPAMDGVILVVKPGRTKVREFRQALRQLQVVGARVLGVVLNEVDPASRDYGYYYNIYYSNNSDYYRGDGINPKRTKEKSKPTPERVV
jgi:non-specific protein-tyrosine kinase